MIDAFRAPPPSTHQTQPPPPPLLTLLLPTAAPAHRDARWKVRVAVVIGCRQLGQGRERDHRRVNVEEVGKLRLGLHSESAGRKRMAGNGRAATK